MQHLAIIMDGNGRWAEQRGLPRLMGHQEGAKAVLRAIAAADKLNIGCISFYAFSIENFKRGAQETLGIFAVIAGFLDNVLLPLVKERGFKVRFIGDLAMLSQELLTSISRVNVAGLNNRGMTINIAIAYSGLHEITKAVNLLMEERLLNADSSEISYDEISKFLYTANLPDPDAVVRYGGYKRLSNFMPLQTVYSELFFEDKLWPDFQEEDLTRILNEYMHIKRNFGELPR